MAQAISFRSLFIFFLIFLASSINTFAWPKFPKSGPKITSTLISEICRFSEKRIHNLCEKHLKPLSGNPLTSNFVKSLGEGTLHGALTRATSAEATFQTRHDERSGSSPSRQYQDLTRKYGEIVTELRNAQSAMENGDVAGVKEPIAEVVRMIHVCDTELRNMRHHEGSVQDFENNIVLRDLSMIILAICNNAPSQS